MKNTSRKNKPQVDNKTGKKNATGNTSVQAAEQTNNAQAKKKNAEVESAKKEILYQVKSKRTSDVLKAYITFTYRVFHPKVTARMLLYGF